MRTDNRDENKRNERGEKSYVYKYIMLTKSKNIIIRL